MGMVAVAALATNTPLANVAITATLRRTSSSHPIKLIVGPAIFDHHVLAVDVAGFLYALPKRPQTIRVCVRRCGVEEPNHRHCWLLRARHPRPCNRPAEKRDDLAASDESRHLIPPAGRAREV